MIRLYVDSHFEVGAELELPASETRYLTSVRRGMGDIEVFNRSGQVGSAERLGRTSVRITKVWESKVPLQALRMSLALPDRNLLPGLITSLSEMGVESLRFFCGDRSQAALKRISSLNSESRWNKLAIESMRQCARPTPIQLQFAEVDLEDLSFASNESVFFFDEATETSESGEVKSNEDNFHVILGPEGGWSERERELSRRLKWRTVHLPTPILRVETAAVAAASWAIVHRKKI